MSKAKIDRRDEPPEPPIERPGCFGPAVVGRPDIGDHVAGTTTWVVQKSPTWAEAKDHWSERFEHHLGGEDFGRHPLHTGGATATSESHILIVGADYDGAPRFSVGSR